MTKNFKLLDLLRRERTELENHLIDGVLAGRYGRRDLIRHGSVLGMSLPLLGGIATAAGLGVQGAFAPARAATPGGTIRVAQTVPAAAIEPVSVADSGGLIQLCQTAEFLCIDGPDLVLQPVLAESWSPNKDGTVWTFKLRRGVKFHNGKELKAEDVVATMDRLSDPKNSSNALSAFTGFLSPGGSKKVDDYTVEFHLEAANGNFPYLVSSDNYNAVIVPADYAGDFEKTFIGTGPFKLEKYTAKVGSSFVRNPDYWGPKALPDRTEFSFFTDIQPQILALQGGQVDVIAQLPVLQSVVLQNDPNVVLQSLRSVAHSQVHMRTDAEPFQDKRVRQALALSINRPKMIQGLLKGRSDIGNDSPFAPLFPSTDTKVPQRAQDIAKAKQLMEAAGAGKGFDVTLTTENFLEIPQYAVLIQNFAKEIGIRINLNVLSQDAYYGDAVYGKSPWLDSVLGITDYGHRGVPNVFLSAPLRSDGTWNSAHFKNKEYDTLVTGYIAALDLDAQRAAAGKIQTLLLDETPVLFTYFYNFLTPVKKGLKGVQATAMAHIFLSQATYA